MRVKDTSDVLASCAAVAGDALAVFTGFILATWLRFDSGVILLFHDAPPANLYLVYSKAAALAVLLFVFIFHSLDLYARPQSGGFGDKIPRLIRATGLGILLSAALAFAIRTEPPFSRITVLLAFITVGLCVLLERYLLFRWELFMARRRSRVNQVIIIGTNSIAARLRKTLHNEPRLGARVVGFFRSFPVAPVHPSISADDIKGGLGDLKAFIEKKHVDQIILADMAVGTERMIELILLCEQSLIAFNLVPDLFHILTGGVDMQAIDDIPLLGVSRWPLDNFWNRLVKRAADMVGAAAGLALFAPVLLVLAFLIKRSSPGPAFFRQERCGEGGRKFQMIKFRTMRVDAESATGPVWAVENDPRRTKIGVFLRRYNLDELPQLWNVLRGEMSLVGPRPERPFFVEQFKEDINRYMWRHVSKPGITGWAQVNGLRGNTDIGERIKYDLYYLEHWSLAFDFKILLKTFLNRENAY
ncbi:MAG: undecaprenyl-phosphate glucose phosphotransferase [Kiritimatiellae bacterium]|nr:undecaprenyl-phosphate glucose phosphotransferase [Kiritimatiellia bacterium]